MTDFFLWFLLFFSSPVDIYVDVWGGNVETNPLALRVPGVGQLPLLWWGEEDHDSWNDLASAEGLYAYVKGRVVRDSQGHPLALVVERVYEVEHD